MRTKILYGLIIFCISLTAIILPSCSGDDHKESAAAGKYTCPMHPQILKDGPGSCPICGMDLVPVNSAGGKNELSLSESQIQLANIKTMKISSAGFKTSKILNGRLIVNPEQTELLSSRYKGRVERLFVKETGRRVVNGQALFQIYSEELQTLQQDYILQMKQVAAFPDEKIYQSMREAAKNKLRLFGYSNTQINALSKGNKTSPLLTVYSTGSGIISEVIISEGQYVSEGSPIIRLENFDQLWLEMDVYPSEIASLKLGTSVKVSINGTGDKEHILKIDFISPQLDPATQILKVRAPIHNPGNLQPGMQATVFLPMAEISDAISLPIDAVIRDANGAHVWIKTGKNTFASRMVSVGEEDADQIIIRSGLENVQEVVVTGAYLLSSEFILKKGADPMAGHDMSKM